MIAVFVLYMVATVSLAYWYSRGARSHREFVLGGGRFGGTAHALSERATGESALPWAADASTSGPTVPTRPWRASR